MTAVFTGRVILQIEDRFDSIIEGSGFQAQAVLPDSSDQSPVDIEKSQTYVHIYIIFHMRYKSTVSMCIVCRQLMLSQTQNTGFAQFFESKADNLLEVLRIIGLEHDSETETEKETQN